MESRFRELQLEYLAPCDCRALPLEAGSIDIVFSRAVLEHVPKEVIAAIFVESHRVLRGRGVALHLVDHSDHWSHRDPRISAVNFLQYSDRLFSVTCLNPQNYQNRLRHSEYREMLEAAGFHVVSEQKTVDARSVTCLKTMRVDERFKRFSPEELATVDSLLFAEA
jgi:SAM-dependent methyltransferase